MLSQRMGFHYGDNIALPESGIYRAVLQIIPHGAAALNGFEPAVFDTEFEYDSDEIAALDLTILDDSRRGQPGAVEPMVHDEHDHTGHDHDEHDDHAHPPVPTAPSIETFPQVIDKRDVGDYGFVIATIDYEGDTYLIVSPRTRYSGFPLPFASLSVEINHTGETESTSLTETTHPQFGLHYGTIIDSLFDGKLTITVESPPQITRHEGYETAFFDPPSFSLQVPQ